MKRLLACLLALLMLTGCSGSSEKKTLEEQMQDTKYAAAPAQVMVMKYADSMHWDAELDVLDIEVIHMSEHSDLPDNVYNIVSDNFVVNGKKCNMNIFATVNGDAYEFNSIYIKEFSGNVIVNTDDGKIKFD